MKNVVVGVVDNGRSITAMYIIMTAAEDNEAERKMIIDSGWLQGGNGYFPGSILLDMENGDVQFSPQAWPNRTMRVAHEFLDRHYKTIRGGELIDIQYILKETTSPRKAKK